MAEGLLRCRFGEHYDAYSAGTAPSRVNPWAIRAMRELGCDISGQVSKHVDEFLDETFDLVVTTCDSAVEACPIFPGAEEAVHHSFEDPAAAAGSNERILAVFRRVRDEIDKWIQETFDTAGESGSE
jgi:arsenate reductase